MVSSKLSFIIFYSCLIAGLFGLTAWKAFDQPSLTRLEYPIDPEQGGLQSNLPKINPVDFLIMELPTGRMDMPTTQGADLLTGPANEPGTRVLMTSMRLLSPSSSSLLKYNQKSAVMMDGTLVDDRPIDLQTISSQLSQEINFVNGQVVIAGWDTSTLPGGAGNYGPSPFAPSETAAHVQVGGLTRGSGVGTSGTAAARGWGGTAWDTLSNSSDNAIFFNEFFTFSVSVDTGYSLSLCSIDPFNYRRSSTGPAKARIQFRINSGGYNDIGTVDFPSTSTSGSSITAIDLTGFAALQNITQGNSVTFRFVPYDASSSVGAFYIFDTDNSNANDLALNGTVSVICPNISFNSTSTNTCFGTSNGQIMVTNVSGGTEPYMYSIDNGMSYQTDATFTGLPVNVYQLVVKDFNECLSGSRSDSVSSISLPLASISVNPNPVCQGSPLRLSVPSAGPGASYEWSGDGILDVNLDSTSAIPLGFGMRPYAVTVTNADDCMAVGVVNVNVTPLPGITCPPNITVCLNTPAFALFGGNPIGGVYSGPGVSAGSFDPAAAGLGSHMINYLISSGGCSNQCSFVINVDVQPAPVWNSLPGDLTLSCNELPQASTLGWTAGESLCQTTGEVEGSILGSVGLCSGFVTEHWSYVSPTGVMIDHERKIFYHIDDEAPVFVNSPEDIFIPCGSSLPAWDEVIVLDNCNAAISISRKQTTAGTRCGNRFYERIWTARDECGNTSQHKQTIRFLDEEPPLLTVPADLTVENGDPIPSPVYVSEDACSWNQVDFQEKRTNHNANEFTLERTWTATDGCGNATQKSQIIEVVDRTAPKIIMVNPRLQGISSGSELVVYDCETPRALVSDIEVEDCCPGVVVEAYDKLLAIGRCDVRGYYQKWECGYRATDAAGNTTVFSFYMILKDTTPPVISNIPKDTILRCTDTIPLVDSLGISATDHCSDLDTIELRETYFYDPIDSSQFALFRTWTVADECGNQTAATQRMLTCSFDTMLLLSDTSQTIEDSSGVDHNLEEVPSLIEDIIKINRPRLPVFDVFPNPVRHYVTLRIQVDSPGDFEIFLIDKLGRTLDYQQVYKEDGQYDQILDLSLYPSGLYTVIVRTKDGTNQTRILKAE